MPARFIAPTLGRTGLALLQGDDGTPTVTLDGSGAVRAVSVSGSVLDNRDALEVRFGGHIRVCAALYLTRGDP
jgi:hypothetical protein